MNSRLDIFSSPGADWKSVPGNLMKGFDPFKVLKQALKRGGEFAELYVEETVNTSIICEEGRIEKIISGMNVGVGVRVLADFKTFFASTNDITEDGLFEVADAVSRSVRGDAPLSRTGSLTKLMPPRPAEKWLTSGVPVSKKVSVVKEGNNAARRMDKRVSQVRVIYGDGVRRVAIVNSLGEWIEGERVGTLYSIQVVAVSGDIIQTGYEAIGGAIGFELFDESPSWAVAETAAKRAIITLDARRAPGGKMPVVLSSEAGGTMVHEAIGHGLEADLAGQGLSVYSGRIGEQVASPLITVTDDATLPSKRGSYSFDDEGVPARRTVLVENGVLRGYMYDRLNAMRDGVLPTGNGRRESYRHRPIPRMTNTMIAPGKTVPHDIVRSVERGLFVKKMGGGQVNTVNGDFVFEVTEGYLIEKGKVGEPVRGATITGNGPEILKQIDMVGSDLGFGIGTCGKDGQGVPVADAQPTLRIPEIVVGGEVEGKA